MDDLDVVETLDIRIFNSNDNVSTYTYLKRTIESSNRDKKSSIKF